LFHAKRRKLANGPFRIDTNADIEDIKIILDNAVSTNQDDGSMYLLKARAYFMSNLP
jgi:hypothetical protein